MNQLNHLFTGFSTLFDPESSTEEKARVKAAIQSRVENNLDLINRVSKETEVNSSHITINY
ncbi:hypothetical protein FHG64_16085 [Antarcticibacterium flavum]|uniref:Uncharacterized protein n=1 Tax=Antarcticibacterium flavum TaxID=2058175 RepID=A0A5B7X7S0_9FLAO|nr:MULTISPECIES: hypothetical protein [Antarcticibacterium]MCM4159535.1 hypothetical protein [Antarcticibacterium sp. W02-3]QCY70788.1 hypothetical protein FHG64_16085 [Antarcticibacterium flavum]